jgi:hypothetical protein
VSTSRTQWHVLFYAALKEHGPPSAEVLAEVSLSTEPLRADILLIRRKDATRPDPDPRTLRALWPYLVREMLIEYKSPSRPPRPYDVAKLIGYGGQLHALRGREIGPFRHLLLGMVVTSLNGALLGDLWGIGAPIQKVAPGYHMVETRPYRLLIVDLSEVVRAEKDEWMAILVPSTLLTAQAKRWLEAHMPTKDIPMDEQLEGHNEVLERLLHSLTPEEIFQAAGTERLLASLPPEQILHAAGTERLLASLPPERLLVALPDSILRALPDDYIRTLPADVQEAIRKRIGAAAAG